MLANILALAVAVGSLAIYLAAFFFPEIHRKNDFIWSGIGLFYAWVLWVFAGRITGGLLLGQIAGVALLGWSVTQTLQLRRQLTPRQQQTIPDTTAIKNTVQSQVSQAAPQVSQVGNRFSGILNNTKNRLLRRQSAASPPTSPAAAKQGEATSLTPPESATESVIPDEKPAVTEEEAITQAVETTQTEATAPESDSSTQKEPEQQ